MESSRIVCQGIEVTHHGTTTVFLFKDRSLNFYVADKLKEQVRESANAAVEGGCTRLVLDFAEVKIIDSTGVSQVVIANNIIRAAEGGEMVYLCNVKPFIIKILEICRIAHHCNIFETQAEALNHE